MSRVNGCGNFGSNWSHPPGSNGRPADYETTPTAQGIENSESPIAEHRLAAGRGVMGIVPARPATFMGRRVEVRETREKTEIELDARRGVTHTRLLTADPRVTLPEHRPPRSEEFSIGGSRGICNRR